MQMEYFRGTNIPHHSPDTDFWVDLSMGAASSKLRGYMIPMSIRIKLLLNQIYLIEHTI